MNTITAYAKAHSDIEGVKVPDVISVEFSVRQLRLYQHITNASKNDPDAPDYRGWWWVNSPNLHEDVTNKVDGSYEGYYEIEGFEGYYSLFLPDFRISGTETRLYKHGHITVVLFLKHSAQEIWANFDPRELIKKLEVSRDDQALSV